MKRYSELYEYNGKLFRYDYENHIVEYVFIPDEDDEVLGWKKGEPISLDGAGLKTKNWENKELRDMYLGEYSFDLDEEARYLAETII